MAIEKKLSKTGVTSVNRKPQSEEKIQHDCIMWFDKKYPEYRLLLVHHYNNPRSAAQGAKLKGLGLKKGIPDLVLYIPNKNYSGLFIEMKNDKGRLQPQQVRYSELLPKMGYKWELCRSLEKFQEIITNYLHI